MFNALYFNELFYVLKHAGLNPLKRSAEYILGQLNPIKSSKRNGQRWNKFINYNGSVPEKLVDEIFIQYFDYNEMRRSLRQVHYGPNILY